MGKPRGKDFPNVLDWMDARIRWDKAHRVRYRLGRIRHHTMHPIRAYRSAVYWPVRRFVERGRRGWSARDVWGFDTYVAEVMAGGLHHLRTTGAGYPGMLTPEQWEAILAEMEDGFRQYAKHYDLHTLAEEEAAYAAVRRSIRLMHRWFGHLWS